MSSKKERLFWHAPYNSIFGVALRILFLIAFIQLLAFVFALGPSWARLTASYFAKKNVIQSSTPYLLAAESKQPIQEVKKKNAQQRSLTPSVDLLEKETIEKTIFSSMETGLQVGEALSIVSVQHLPGAEGEHILKIGIKSLIHESISIPEVKVQVYFYDQIEGKIVASQSPVTSRWINPAVDWNKEEPQLLQVIYQPNINNPEAHYLGYIVAVYYKGELQAYRADPPTITNQFPIKVYIGHDDFL